MAMNTFQDALNDCIDRLANGQTIEDCLRIYPQYARQLEIALSLGQAMRQAQADETEVQAARFRVWSELQGELDDWDTSAPHRTSNPRLLWLLAAVLLIGVTGMAAFLAQPPQNDETIMTLTPQPTLTNAPTPTVTATPTNTVTPSPTVTAMPSATFTPTPSSDLEATQVACSEALPDDWTTYAIQETSIFENYTLREIAAEAGVSLVDLSRINCLDASQSLSEANRIFVPDSAVAVLNELEEISEELEDEDFNAEDDPDIETTEEESTDNQDDLDLEESDETESEDFDEVDEAEVDDSELEDLDDEEIEEFDETDNADFEESNEAEFIAPEPDFEAEPAVEDEGRSSEEAQNSGRGGDGSGRGGQGSEPADFDDDNDDFNEPEDDEFDEPDDEFDEPDDDDFDDDD